MKRAKRINRSEAARFKRHKLKDIILDCTVRKFNRLRKLRKQGKKDTTV
jgi:hypothetical protein